MKKVNVQMVDLMGQYSKIKHEIDKNIISTIESGRFVNGPIVKKFSENLSKYLNINSVIPCANELMHYNCIYGFRFKARG